jgi:hypothetical protein
VYINVYRKNNYGIDLWKEQYRTTNQDLQFFQIDTDPLNAYLIPQSPTLYYCDGLVSWSKLQPVVANLDRVYKTYYNSTDLMTVQGQIKVDEEFYFNGRRANNSRWQLYSHNKVVFHNPSYASDAKYGYPVDFTVTLPPHKVILGKSLTKLFVQDYRL